MGEIVLFLGELFMIIIELTWWALVFIYYGLMAMFSPRHRAKFVKEWRESTLSRIGMVLVVGVAIVWVGSMAWFWTNFLISKPEPTPQDRLAEFLTPQAMERLVKTKELPDLATETGKAAIEKFKSTWKLRPSDKEADDSTRANLDDRANE